MQVTIEMHVCAVVVVSFVSIGPCDFSISVNSRGKEGMTTEEMRKLIERSVMCE